MAEKWKDWYIDSDIVREAMTDSYDDEFVKEGGLVVLYENGGYSDGTRYVAVPDMKGLIDGFGLRAATMVEADVQSVNNLLEAKVLLDKVLVSMKSASLPKELADILAARIGTASAALADIWQSMCTAAGIKSEDK